MLCSVGDVGVEVVTILAAAPRRGGEVRAAVAHQPGGRSGVVAIVARWAGSAARVVGQLGADDVGDLVAERLAALGVEVCGPRLGRTATTVILVDDEREPSRLVDRAASVKLGSVPSDVLDGCRILHLPLSALTTEPLATTAYDLIGRALDQGVELAIDLVSPDVVDQFGASEAAALVRTARPSVLVGSRTEVDRLRSGTRDAVAGAALTLATNGARPTLAIEATGAVTSVPVRPIERLVDRSGRGAAFVGAYLAARLAGSDLVGAVEGGHRGAAAVLASPGGVPREAGSASSASSPTKPR